MTAVGKTDEMIRDYLLFRGFTSTLKAFDSDLKNEKEKGFRADRVLDQLLSYVSNYDIVGLREYWNFLDSRIFCRLEHVYMSSIRKLEVSLFKYYVANAVQNNKLDKVNEFYEKCTVDLQHQGEWKDWFILPFVKNPEESVQFAVYFSRQWQDTFLLSLHNFLSVITHAMPVPALLAFEEDRKRMVKLQQENEKYKQQITSMVESGEVNSSFMLEPDMPTPTQDPPAAGNMDLMDDFFHISQDTTIDDKSDSPVKTSQIRSFIKNIGLPSSPVLGKKAPPNTSSATTSTSSTAKPAAAPGRRVSSSAEPLPGAGPKNKAKEDFEEILSAENIIPKPKKRPVSGPVSSVPSTSHMEQRVRKLTVEEKPVSVARAKSSIPVLRSTSVPEPLTQVPESKAPNSSVTMRRDTAPPVDVPEGRSSLLLLSQEEYAEHRSAVTHCRFNPHAAQVVATSDVDGVVKVWALQPSPVTMATIMSKSMLISLDWLVKSDRLLLLGNKAGSVRLFDVREKKTLREVQTDASFPRIVSLSCCPDGLTFACSASSKSGAIVGDASTSPRSAHLALYDVKTMKLQTKLAVGPDTAAVNCTSYSQNGQLLLTGASDGFIRIYDGQQQECVHSWAAHTGDVHTALFTPDLRSVYSMGADGKFIEWNLSKGGAKTAELNIHQGACGPFVLTGAGGYRHVQAPNGRLFAFDSDAKHVLTCATNGGLVYQLGPELKSSLLLPGHKTPITTVDWSLTGDCGMCLTGSMDGALRVSTLIPPS